MSNRAHRLVAAGALAVAAVAAPIAIAVTSVEATDSAAPPCLAWFGNKEDGRCLSYSDGGGATIGGPNVGVFGRNGGIGVSTSNLFPGTTWTQPIG